MSGSLEQERRLVEYLLGRMPEEERPEVEERVFTDDGFDEELQATVDDLIHAYLAGRLSRDDQVRFETHFLATPRHRQRLAFVRDLLSAVERVSAEEAAAVPPPATPRTRRFWALAAAVTLAAVGGSVLLMLQFMERGPERATASPPPSPSTAPLQATPATPEPQRPETATVRLAARPPASGSPVAITLTPRTRAVRMEVAVDGDHPSFDAVVRTNDGKEVWRAEGLAPSASGELLVLMVPARVFASERYTLQVEGESLRDAATRGPRVRAYALQVLREP